jgi:hypothetical protein
LAGGVAKIQEIAIGSRLFSKNNIFVSRRLAEPSHYSHRDRANPVHSNRTNVNRMFFGRSADAIVSHSQLRAGALKGEAQSRLLRGDRTLPVMIAVALGRLPLQLARSVKPAVVRVTARHNNQTPLNASMNALRYHLFRILYISFNRFLFLAVKNRKGVCGKFRYAIRKRRVAY